MDQYKKEFELEKKFFEDGFSTVGDLIDTSKMLHHTLLNFWIKKKEQDREPIYTLSTKIFALSNKLKAALKIVPPADAHNRGVINKHPPGDGLTSLQQHYEKRQS